MSSHISYHPLGTDVIRKYVEYLSSSDAASHAAYDYDGTSAHERFRQPFIKMADTARTLIGNFDETHGLNLAVTQGFFGTYYYLHNARLSALGDILAPYVSGWHDLVPGWQATETARNRLGDVPSSGVFITARHIEPFMNDMHTSTELQAAIAREFPTDKLHVLWSALTVAHQSGLGLLEASGVIEPDAADITQSTCRTNQTNCHPAGLRLYLTQAASTPVARLAVAPLSVAALPVAALRVAPLPVGLIMPGPVMAPVAVAVFESAPHADRSDAE